MSGADERTRGLLTKRKHTGYIKIIEKAKVKKSEK